MSGAAPPSPRLSYIPEILEQHYEDLQSLWSLRTTALRSPRFTLRDLAKLDERIEAHVQGMLIVGESLRDLVEPGLVESDPSIAFAAAFALLRLERPSTTRLVLDRFTNAEGPALDGIRDALCHGAPPNTLREIEFLAGGDNAPVAASALEVLTYRSATPPAAEQAFAFLNAESPIARRIAWRVLSAIATPAEPKALSAAMRDDDPLVRRDAIWAAVSARVPGILLLARKVAENTDPEQLDLYRVLAVLGREDERQRIETLAASTKLEKPDDRLSLLGAYGWPGHVEMLIERMAPSDPEVAVAAGAAFMRVTGIDVSSLEMATLPPDEPTGDAELDAAFAREEPLPDPARARKAWGELRPRVANAVRISRGADVSRGASAEQLASFDLASRWDMAARNRFYGLPAPSTIELARYPTRAPRS
jgi:uncharacterized protein (TIGR02270 family)